MRFTWVWPFQGGTSLLVFAVDILPCMCLAALCPSVALGKGLRPASPVRQLQHLLHPLFWPSMLSTVFLYLVSFFVSWAYLWFYLIMRQFTKTLRTLRMSLKDIAKVLKQAVTEIWVMGRAAGKPKVVAFQQKRRRPACADISTTKETRKLVSDFVVQSLESIIDKFVTSKISAFYM